MNRLTILILAATLGAIGLTSSEINWAQPVEPVTKRTITKLAHGTIPILSEALAMLPESQAVEGEFLIKYKEDAYKAESISTRVSKLNEVGERLHKQYQIEVLATSPTLGIQRINIPKTLPGTSLTPFAAITSDSSVELLEPNYKIYPLGTPQPAPPDDQEWKSGEQWGMVKIGMKTLWDSGVRGGDIVIAVLDSGIDYTHPDLAPNMWQNPAPTFGDIHGADFCHRAQTTREPSGNPMDDMGHGTMVSGVIAAKGNNTINVAGVSWTAKLMALKVLCKERAGTVGDAVEAIDYAIQHKALVINSSWGFSNFHGGLKTAIEKANQANILFVAAAGNSSNRKGNDNDIKPVYPASYQVDNVIAVAATDENDQLWSDSHWGINSVHLAAPGVYIVSTMPGAPQIGEGDGTSLAAPHVTGCAALLLAKRGAAAPPLRPTDLKTALTTAGDQPAVLKNRISDGRRLNCERAIASMP